MKLIKTTLFTSIITLVRIATNFITCKVVAIITGPSGLALVGAFVNLITIATTFSSGAINTGVVKYTSEYANDSDKLKKLFSTSIKIAFYFSVFIGVLLFIFAPNLSFMIFKKIVYSGPIRVLGFSMIMFSLNSVLLSILNGLGQVKAFTIVNAIGNLVGLLLTLTLVFYFKIEGVLYALAIGQSAVFFLTVVLVVKSKWFSWNYFKQPFNKILAIKLSHFSLMAMVSAITLPVAQIIIRNMLTAKIGLDSAGYWQGMMRISDGYLMLITSSLSIYYLPKLASLKTNLEIRKEVLNGYKLILPVVFFGCCLIYILRIFIINILYNDDFLKMEPLFLWQLIGDFFKIAAWILSYLMLAKAMVKTFIVTEIVFNSINIILSFYFIEIFNLKGIALAFALNYLLYLLTLLFIFRKLLFKKSLSTNP